MAIDIRQPSVEVPPLQHGDRLTRAEFERRWGAMPELKKAELINGVVHMPPLSRYHGVPHSDLGGLLWYYGCQTPGVEAATGMSIRLDDDNMPQPDSLLRVKESRGGRSDVDEEGYLISGPELIAEVARSSSAYDLGDKFDIYQRYGVPEYIVWRVKAKTLDWYVLRAGAYQRLDAGTDGILRSEVFPGLWLDAAALLGGDATRCLAIANRGLASTEHADFVQELRRRAGS